MVYIQKFLNIYQIQLNSYVMIEFIFSPQNYINLFTYYSFQYIHEKLKDIFQFTLKSFFFQELHLSIFPILHYLDFYIIFY